MKSEKTLKKIAITIVIVMLLLQIVTVLLFDGRQIEDSGNYQNIAKGIAMNQSFYPDESHLYDTFMANPGYINYLSIYYRIADNDKLPLLGNIILLVLLLYVTFYISLKLFKNKKLSYLIVILFATFPAFTGELLNMRSELLFTLLALGAIAIVLSNIKGKYIIAGVILGLANWVRPLALVFLIVTVLVMLYQKEKLRQYAVLIATIVVMVLSVGAVTYISSGNFLYQSITGGVNFIMGANDDADGSFNWEVFEKGNTGYLEDGDTMTYLEKDEYWMEQSIKWIRENPGEYIKLIPKKIFYMYSIDTYAFSTLYNNEVITSGREYLEPLFSNLKAFNLKEVQFVDYVVVINQLLYMIYFILFVVSLVLLLIKKQYKAFIILFGIILLGTGMTIVTVGGARYHYPYLPIIIIGCSYAMAQLIFERKNRVSNV